jgi:hypothetical protein
MSDLDYANNLADAMTETWSKGNLAANDFANVVRYTEYFLKKSNIEGYDSRAWFSRATGNSIDYVSSENLVNV